MKTMALPQMKYQTIPFAGGMDQVTPLLRLKPGVARDALNFECVVTGGYGRISGYERFDGKAKPADATYSIVQLTAFVNKPTAGQTLTGQTTGTTGVIVAIGEDYLILTLIVGAGFSTTEVVKVGATLIGTATEVTVSISPLSNALFLNAAADVYRALIAAVPGSGNIRGVFSMVTSGVHEVFAFRNNAGGTACNLYKSSGSSWVQVAYLYEIAFTTGGTGVPADGDTLTRGGNSAVIKRVMLESGSWAAGTAAGKFVIAAPTPGSFTAGAATAGAVNVTLSGAETAITMLPNGTFEFDRGNFSGQRGTLRIYGCDKVNRAFEFDGVTLAPIKTGLTSDAPWHIAAHQNHLFIGYKSSVLHSGIGTPFNWTATAGAAEYSVSDTVTGLKVQPGAQDAPAMLIGIQSTVKVLYGSSAADFKIVNFNTEVGTAEHSLQNLDRGYLLSSVGVTDLARAQEFGNFAASTITFPLQPYIEEKRSLTSASCTHKSKSQYRLFFSDGSGLFLTIVNGKPIGGFPVYFPNPVTCIWNGQLANGNEVIYFGSSNGMVYQMERGSSFDGAAIDFYLEPNWDNMDSPRVSKSYFKASLELHGNNYAVVNFEYKLGYGSTEYERLPPVPYESSFQGASRWDSGMLWDAFIWDGATLGPTEIDVCGTAENIQARLSGSSDYLYPFTLSSLTYHYLPRRGLR